MPDMSQRPRGTDTVRARLKGTDGAPDISHRPRERGTGERPASRRDAPPRGTGSVRGRGKPSVLDYLKRYSAEVIKFLKKLFANRLLRLGVIAAAAVLLLAFGIGTIIGAATAMNAVEVYISGTLFTTVNQPKLTSDAIKNQIIASIQKDLGDTPVRLTDEIKVKPVHAKTADMKPFDTALAAMLKAVRYQFQAVALNVGGVKFAVLRTQADCDGVLDRIKAQFTTAATTDATFVETVSCDPVFVTDADLTTADKAFAALTATVDTPEDYIIKAGDTLEAVALAYGIDKQKIYDLNPGIKDQERRLQIGQHVTVVVPKPVLSVKTVTPFTYTTVVPKQTVTHEVADKPRSYRAVSQQGSDGQKEVTENIVRINGFEQPDHEPVSEKITVAPVDEIIDVGVS